MIRIDIKVNPESNQTLGVQFYMFAFIIALYAGHYCAETLRDIVLPSELEVTSMNMPEAGFLFKRMPCRL